MIWQVIMEVLFPALGVTVIVLLIVLCLFWIVDAIASIVRAADALERIADVLEGDDEDEAENNEENLTPGTVCAGSLRPPRIVPGASTTQDEGEVGE